MAMWGKKSGALEKSEQPCEVCAHLDANQKKTKRFKVQNGAVVPDGVGHYCGICLYLSNLELAGRQRAGYVILAPEVTQKAINDVVRAIVMMRGHQGRQPEPVIGPVKLDGRDPDGKPYAAGVAPQVAESMRETLKQKAVDEQIATFKPWLDAAMGVHRALMARSDALDRLLGDGACDPDGFATAVEALPSGFANPVFEALLLKGLRFLPTPERFDWQCNDIVAARFEKMLDPEAWDGMLAEFKSMTGEATA